MTDRDLAPAGASSVQTRRWDPFDSFSQVLNEIDRIWTSLRADDRSPLTLAGDSKGWAPRVDIFEKNGQLVVKAELPGIKKEDLDVKVEQGNLSISGERKEEHEVEKENYFHRERRFGSFFRRIPIPEGVDTEKIEVTFSDGVLEVRMPQPQSKDSEAKTIPIKTS